MTTPSFDRQIFCHLRYITWRRDIFALPHSLERLKAKALQHSRSFCSAWLFIVEPSEGSKQGIRVFVKFHIQARLYTVRFNSAEHGLSENPKAQQDCGLSKQLVGDVIAVFRWLTAV